MKVPRKNKKEAEVDYQIGLTHMLKAAAPKSENGVEAVWDVETTDEMVLAQVEYTLTTGIKTFDDLIGGFPMGRVVEVFGLESSGKSALVLLSAARAKLKHISRVVRETVNAVPVLQPLNPDDIEVLVLYVDNEQSLDCERKLTLEGQVVKITNFRCDTTENLLRAIDKTLDYAEDTMAKLPHKKVFTVIVVDTIASTTTQKELTADWGAQDYPRQPQLLSKGFSRLMRRVNSLNACLICTNQVRGKFDGAPKKGGPYAGVQAKDYKAPGGFSLRFYATHRVFLHALDSKYRLLPTAKFAAGLAISFFSIKNRIKPPLREGRMVLLFDAEQGGLRDDWSLLESLVYLGFIEPRAKEKAVNFVVKFKKFGIVPTTFDVEETTTTLDEDDEQPTARRSSSRKDPEFKFRSDWPKFLDQHREDIMKLWQAAVAYCVSTPGLGTSVDLDELEKLDNAVDIE